jgi:hypothetical protein
MGAVHSPEANRDLAVTPDCPPAKTNPSPDFNFFDYANLSGVTASSFRFPMLSTAKVNPMPQTFNIEVPRVIHFSIVRSSAAKLFSYAKGAAGVSSVGFQFKAASQFSTSRWKSHGSRSPRLGICGIRSTRSSLAQFSRVRQQAV